MENTQNNETDRKDELLAPTRRDISKTKEDLPPLTLSQSRMEPISPVMERLVSEEQSLSF